MNPLTTKNTLTKADTVALWYAVDSYEWAIKAMKQMPFLLPERVEEETARLKAAKQALRKVNAIRREQ